MRDRFDIVMSQATTILMTAFVSAIKAYNKEPLWFRQLQQIGLLCHFESLLSTSGDEMGMLEDMTYSVGALANMTITLVSEPQRAMYAPRITGSRMRFTVQLNVPSTLFASLPVDLQSGSPIHVHPVIFTQVCNCGKCKRWGVFI
jgi:inositol polyphosphate-4-phosphatase